MLENIPFCVEKHDHLMHDTYYPFQFSIVNYVLKTW